MITTGANTIVKSIILPASSGERLLSGQIKSKPADFQVREKLDFDFDGQGEHLYLYVRKCGLNTIDVVEILQRAFQCQSVDIGVSGLKDKNAITDQWFSIRTPKNLSDTDLLSMILPTPHAKTDDSQPTMSAGEVCVLESHRHNRKLRRGAHRYNRFTITVRNIENSNPDIALSDALESRLGVLQTNGFANYFGPQRFGIDFQNLAAADRLFANPKRKLSRNKRSILISAARSQLFNSVCAERVKSNNWNLPLNGEPMVLDGTHSFFINEPPNATTPTPMSSEVDSTPDTIERCRQRDIHPTGPMWGRGDTLATGECKLLETSILNQYPTFCDGLEKAGLKQQRRALRASVECLAWQWQEPSIVTLEFNLLKGVYATSFLSEFMINL